LPEGRQVRRAGKNPAGADNSDGGELVIIHYSSDDA
jgi:hypothetical protein